MRILGTPMSDTGNIFTDEIDDEPGICNNCFKRTHEVAEMRYPQQVKNRPIVGTALRNERFFSIPENTEKVYPVWEQPAHHPAGKNACECGSISQSVKVRPLSKSDAIEYTENIAKRLSEKSIIFSEDMLFDHVRREKEKADRQHEDDEIFAEAVSKAISHGYAEEQTA